MWVIDHGQHLSLASDPYCCSVEGGCHANLGLEALMGYQLEPERDLSGQSSDLLDHAMEHSIGHDLDLVLEIVIVTALGV